MATSGLELVATPRGPVAVHRVGAGPPLLLIAGLGSSHRLWGELPRLLAHHFTVLAPDNRGIGGSRQGEPFTLDGAADDMADVIAALGGGSAAVLGASLGGVIACRLALRHPAAVRRLALASCGARPSPHTRRISRLLELLLTRMAPDEAAETLMTLAFAPGFTDRYPGFVADAAALWQPDPADLPGALAQLAALEAAGDERAALAAIACPVLAIAGDLDPIVPPGATRELADAVPWARFRPVPGASHSVLAEGGPALLAEVVAFLTA